MSMFGTAGAAPAGTAGIYGSVPPVGTPKAGGTITQGQLTGQTPTFIFPIVPGANTTTGTISLLTSVYMPLYAGPTGNIPKVDLSLSAAASYPIFSNGDKTVTIPLRHNLHWGNGAPVVANDVVFWFDLLKAAVKESPANWGQYTPGLMPDNVASITTSGPYTVVMHLKSAYNPGFFLNNNLEDTDNVYPLPSTDWNIDATGGPHLTDWSNPAVAKKIYDYLAKQGGSVATFGSNPLWKDGDGPFKLTSFSATNSSYTLVPNPRYEGTPKPIMSEVMVETYTGFTAELNALKAGTLDVMVGLDPSQLAEAPALKAQGIYIVGSPEWGWFGATYNFEDKTNDFDKVIAQVYIRQVFAYLLDEPTIIKGIYKNAAAETYTEVPSYPPSPYAPASAAIPPFPYSPSKAVAILKAHGWDVVPGGTTKCVKPGTAANECGAGIPAGTPIAFVWANQPEAVSSVGALESEVFASVAKADAGIDVTLQTKSFNFLTSDYNDENPAAAKYTNDWGVNNFGGLFTDYYPTAEGVWNPGAGFNLGAFDDPTANSLMQKSEHSGSANAIKTEASYIETHPPVLFMPDQDYLIAVNSNKVAGPADGWLAMTQQQWFPQYWYVK